MSSWKDNPLAVSAITVAGTLALSVLVVKDIIVPTYTQSIKNELSLNKIKLEKALKINEKNKLRVKDLEKEVVQLREHNVSLTSQLKNSLATNVFSFNNPYPKGFGEIRVGDNINLLAKKYGKDKIEIKLGDVDTYTTYNLKIKHKFFERVTYYIEDDDNTIEKMSFSIPQYDKNFKKLFDGDYLHNQLTDALGSPITWNKKEYYSWYIGHNLAVYKSSDFSFSIAPKDKRPAYWPSIASK